MNITFSLFLFASEVPGYTVCGHSHLAKATTGQIVQDDKLTFAPCVDTHKCYNATYRLEKTLEGGMKVFVDGSVRGCVDAVNCSDLYSYGKSQLETDNTLKMISGNGQCCDGDFCNLGNAAPTPGDYLINYRLYLSDI